MHANSLVKANEIGSAPESLNLSIMISSGSHTTIKNLQNVPEITEDNYSTC